MGHLTKRAIGWTAPLALVAAAGLAACGDGDSTTAQTAGVATGTMGSDVHLENLANDIAARTTSERGCDVHLQNLADDIAARSDTTSGGTVEVAAAEAASSEHDAHLSGNADTYGAEPAGSDDEFVPGTRHMPVR